MFISDNESFNPSLWEEQRKQRAQVAFECDEDKDEREAPPRVCIEFIFMYLAVHFTLLNRSSHQFRVSIRMKHCGLVFFVVFAFSLGILGRAQEKNSS